MLTSIFFCTMCLLTMMLANALGNTRLGCLLAVKPTQLPGMRLSNVHMPFGDIFGRVHIVNAVCRRVIQTFKQLQPLPDGEFLACDDEHCSRLKWAPCAL